MSERNLTNAGLSFILTACMGTIGVFYCSMYSEVIRTAPVSEEKFLRPENLYLLPCVFALGVAGVGAASAVYYSTRHFKRREKDSKIQ